MQVAFAAMDRFLILYSSSAPRASISLVEHASTLRQTKDKQDCQAYLRDLDKVPRIKLDH